MDTAVGWSTVPGLEVNGSGGMVGDKGGGEGGGGKGGGVIIAPS